MSGRRLVLALVLAVTLLASFWPRQESVDLVEAVVKPKAPTQQAAMGASIKPLGGNRTVAAAGVNAPRFAESAGGNLFPAQSFRPPPKPVPPPVILPPPPPSAPPLPFAFVGAWNENGQETVFLERGNQLFTAKVGADLPDGWRLDAMTPESLTFTYVSLNQQRTLRIAP